MNNFYQEKIDFLKNLIPIEKGDGFNFEKLYNTPFKPFLLQMETVEQNPVYHGEGSVLNHTKKVVENIIALPEYYNGSFNDKLVLFLAALLHDIGKIKKTKIEDGEITSRGHALYGSLMAREFLYKTLGFSGEKTLLNIRESVCSLIRYHSYPPYALSKEDAKLKIIKMASNAQLYSLYSNQKLYALEKADILGRISKDNSVMLENLEYFKLLCQENNVFESYLPFKSNYVKRAYFLQKTSYEYDELFVNSWGTVILLSGLAGVGKDTFIKNNYPNLPVISLDDIRTELKIKPTDNQSAVIALAKEKAKDFLRNKRPFIWNATNITYQVRSSQIELFERYNASVKIIYLETNYEENLLRNKNRNSVVPENVINKMLSKLEPPENFESETVEYIIT